jgi:aspartate kinase
MSIKIIKFGGTSTGSGEALNRAADIVQAQTHERDQIVVVVSAMQGVTDMLIACADHARTGDQGQLQITIDELHHKLSSIVVSVFAGGAALLDLIEIRMAELTQICQRIQDQGIASPQDLAQITALGERINVHVFSAALRDRGLRSEPVDAVDLIVTDDRFQSAKPIKALTDTRIKSRLSPLLGKALVPVFTGFIGGTTSGQTTTLGRGGSDYSAAILAESLAADEIQIWTDVDGVMTADPVTVPRARLIEEISYSEVFQLANSGAEVLHPKTILPAKEGDIPIIVKNTFKPEGSGTRISHCSNSVRQTIASVTGRFDIRMITFELKTGENVQKIKSHLLATLKEQGTDIWAIFQSEQQRTFSFAISAKNKERALQTIRDPKTTQSFGRAVSQPKVTKNLSLITLVGQDIYLSHQVQSSVSDTLHTAGVDIKQIGNGASPDAIVFAVESRAAGKAIQLIHDRIVLNGSSTTVQPEPVLRHQPAL